MDSSTKKNKSLAALSLAALGVVYGDIGTSPLYAFEQVFSNGAHSVAINLVNILGVLSLFFWSLMMIVTVKYVCFIMRADNEGEGGIIALMALSLKRAKAGSKGSLILLTLGIIGAAFFYGDGVITPAISVLSAVEGLEILSPKLKDLILPVSISILLILFWVQKSGTSKIGMFFGPVMSIWFITIGALGFYNILGNPEVLKAINPLYALEFLYNNKIESFFALGAVVLCLTGAEALYADMGHFGKKPIRIVWSSLVLPCLILNYFGQGSLLLSNPKALDNLFYFMAPDSLQTPLVILATFATVIASQAVISGTFSMTREAIQLGLFPRFKISQTSATEVGQIYLPIVNYTLCVLVVSVILIFQSSNALGSAYGIAVTGTMLITDFLAIAVVIQLWGWTLTRAIFGSLFFICIDFVFFSSNTLKIVDGGWLPILVSLVVITIMTTWYKGYKILVAETKKLTITTDEFIKNKIPNTVQRLDGVAFYLTSDLAYMPISVLRTIKHFNTIHKKCYILSAKKAFSPYVKRSERINIKELGDGFYSLELYFGFMERANIPREILKAMPELKMLGKDQLSYIVGRQIISITNNKNMMMWRKKLFKFFYRNSDTPLDYFSLPEEDALAFSVKVEI